MTSDTTTDATYVDAANALIDAALAWLEVHDGDIQGFLSQARSVFNIMADEFGYTTDPHWLYRLYDEKDRLLYVGITRNFDARIAAHERRLGDLLDYYTYDEYPDRRSVLAAEALAIDTEYPALNVSHPRVK